MKTRLPLRLAAFALWSGAAIVACASSGARSQTARGAPAREARDPALAPVASAARIASAAGCADGTREAFRDLQRYTSIAGCAGGWTVPGILAENPRQAPACPGLRTFATNAPQCARRAGNDGADPFGQGCDVEDLCAQGWHVCRSAEDVAQHSPDGCAGANVAADPPGFFAARQSSNGCVICALGARAGGDCNSAACTPGCAPGPALSNDVFGCGNFGSPSACGVLDRFSDNLCTGLAGSTWQCDAAGTADDPGLCEAYTVTKNGPAFGGVLCCQGE